MSIAKSTNPGHGLESLPAPLVEKLTELIRRVRRIALIKGTFAVIATGLVCLLTIMAIDATTTIFSPAVRWMLSLGGLAITASAAWWWVLRPATKRITLATIAHHVEERHPELEETLSSAIELLASDDPDEIRGSEELIREVVKTATRDAEQVSPAREFDTAVIRRYAVSALAIGTVFSLIFLIWPKPASKLLARAVAPFLEIGNAYADTLTVVPGDLRVAQGADVLVEASIKHPRLNRATVRRLDTASGQDGVERMTLAAVEEDDLRRFTLTFPNAQEDFSYRVHAGNALSRYFQVTVIEPPRVDAVRLRFEYPDYTRIDPQEVLWEGGEIAVLENTRVTFTAALNRSVSEPSLFLGQREIDPIPPRPGTPEAEVAWEVALKRGLKEDWHIALRDADGFENEPTYAPIRAIPDQIPTVRILSPDPVGELRLRPNEFLPIHYEATEDWGFSAAQAIIDIEGRGENVIQDHELPVAVAGGRWEGRVPLELARLDLDNVRNLTVRVRLADNLPDPLKGPQEVLSEPIRIRIEKSAKPLIEQVFDSQEAEIRHVVEEARKDLRQAKYENDQLQRQLQREEPLTPEALEKLSNARREMSEAEQRLTELAERMENTVFQDRAREMASVVEEQIEPAREEAELIPLTDDAAERVEQADAIEERLEEALTSLDEVLENLRESQEEVEQVARLSDMALRQRQLADEAIEAAAEQQAREALNAEEDRRELEETLEEWRDDQERLQAELAEMLRESPEAFREVLEERQQEALRIASQAEQLAREQENLRSATELARNPETAEQLAEQLMEQLRQEQEAIASETRELGQEMAEARQERLEDLLREAGREASDTARQLQRENVEAARENAAEAAEALNQAADSAEQAAAREALAQTTEEAIRDALPPEVAARPEVREAVAAAAEALAEQMAENQAAARAEAQANAPVEGQPESSPDGSPESPAVTPEQLQQALGEAIQAAAEAARAEGSPPSPETVAEAARQAAEALGLDPEAMPSPASPSTPPSGSPAAEPTPDPATREALAQLAERQEDVAGVLDSLERGQLEEAIAQMQESITGQAEALMAEAQAMEQAAALARENEARSWADQAERQINTAESRSEAATQALESAQASQDQAQAQMAQEAARSAGQSPPSEAEALAQAQSGDLPPTQPGAAENRQIQSALQAQQQARDALAMAAERMEGTAEALGEAASQLAPNQAAPEDSNRAAMAPEDLAQSFNEVSEAARAESNSQAAAEASQAAQSLQQMAQQAAQSMGALSAMTPQGGPNQPPGQPGQPGAPPNPAGDPASASQPNEGQAGRDTAAQGVPPELEKLGISSADWARIKGTLGSDINNQGSTGAPQEYRGLVSDYFRIIASEARKGNP